MTSTDRLDRKGKVMCGVDPNRAGQLLDELALANVANAIDIVGWDGAGRLGHPPDDCGIVCQINRVVLGMGSDLDEYAWERERLDCGEVLVAVPFTNGASEERICSIMAGYCQTPLHRHGAWTTKVL